MVGRERVKGFHPIEIHMHPTHIHTHMRLKCVPEFAFKKEFIKSLATATAVG